MVVGDRPRFKLPIQHGASGALSGDKRGGSSQHPPPRRIDHVRANHVTASVPALSAHTAIIKADCVSFSGLNDQQWKTLVHILNEGNSGSND